ncbi:ATP-binding cassette domain-containing protein [Desulfuromonas versatilis]|nr:ATP-binding cassette domain-containing protein [Desulfuromonas versatilis]
MNALQSESPPPPLAFEGVTTEPDPAYDVPLWELSFSLGEGELLLVMLERGQYRIPLADVALGITEPAQGRVLFLGEDWRRLGPTRGAARRGRCGRVFATQGWCAALAVNDNITLAQRHHTLRSVEQIEAEATNLARYFGLPGLPLREPGRTRPGDLGRAALARAFLGRPALLLLEEPTRHLYPEILPPLLNALRAARRRGAAVLWTTSEPRLWNEQALDPTWKGTMYGSRMQLQPGRTP